MCHQNWKSAAASHAATLFWRVFIILSVFVSLGSSVCVVLSLSCFFFLLHNSVDVFSSFPKCLSVRVCFPASLSRPLVPPPLLYFPFSTDYVLIVWLCHMALAWCWWCRPRWPTEGNFIFFGFIFVIFISSFFVQFSNLPENLINMVEIWTPGSLVCSSWIKSVWKVAVLSHPFVFIHLTTHLFRQSSFLSCFCCSFHVP